MHPLDRKNSFADCGWKRIIDFYAADMGKQRIEGVLANGGDSSYGLWHRRLRRCGGA